MSWLRAEAGGWVGQVTRLTTIYYSSYVQQQRKEKQKNMKWKQKKIPWTSKASSTKNKPRKKQKQKNDVTGVAKIIHPYKKENKQNKNLRENK